MQAFLPTVPFAGQSYQALRAEKVPGIQMIMTSHEYLKPLANLEKCLVVIM